MRSKQTQKQNHAHTFPALEDGLLGREIYGGWSTNLFWVVFSVLLPLLSSAQNPTAGNQGFQIMAEQNFTFTGYTHVHGALGVGGNLTLNCNGVLAEICMDGVSSYVFPGDGTTTTGLLVKGGVTWTNGGAKVMGGKYLHIGNSAGCIQSDNGVNMATQVLPTGGTYNQARRIEGALDQTPSPSPFQSVAFDFTSLFNTYRANSEGLAACSNNVQLYNASNVAISGNNVSIAQNVQINTLANGVNHLDLTQASLNNITELKFNAGALPSSTKLLVINVPLSANFTWNNFNMPGLSGFNNGAYILWNFSGATSYTLTINTSALIIGTIFAPNHSINKIGTGDIDGDIYGKNITLGLGEVHLYPFNGNIPLCSTCSNLSSAGTIGATQSGCSASFNPVLLTETAAPTGGSGSFEYQWQSSPNNSTWTDISGATSQTYDPPAISTTTYYRRGARRSGCTTYLYSSSVTMTVNTTPTATIPGTPTICAGNSVSISATGGGTYLWSTGGTSATINVSPVTTTTYTVTVTAATGGCTATANGTVTVNALPTAPTASTTVQPTCAVQTGTIVITAPIGANLEYTVNGTTYQSSTSFSGVSPGTYSVKVRNTTTGCISNGTNVVVNAVPGGCATCTTTTFFTETFGTGGRASHPYTNYCYEDGTGDDCLTFAPSTQINDGEYALAQAPRPASINSDWTTDGDHTGDVGGRLMVVNAALPPGEFYRRTITGVYPNADVTVDLWLRNTILPGYNLLKPNVTFKLETTTGTVLGTVHSGDLPEDNTWHNYVLNINPGNNISVVVVLVNNGPGGTGNDLGLDDIVAKQILVPPTPTVNATCANPTATITVSSPTGANYQYSINGSTYQSSTTFASVATGTYNVTVKSMVTGCVSAATSVTVVNAPTISAHPTGGTICAGFTHSLSVTASGATAYQWQISTDNVTFTDISGATSSTYATATLTTTRYFKVKVYNGASCNITSSAATVTVQNCIEVCNNGIDDDGDGLIDMADFDCNSCPSGSVFYERWTSISGGAIANLTSYANYPNSPNATGTFSSLDGPDNVADNYGTRVRGYLLPNVTGTYSFNLTSDDDSQLFLSTNELASNKVMIASVTGYTGTAEYTKYPSQTSANITLTAGNKYYIEILQKDNTGGDHFQVYWKTPSSSTWTIVPGARLSPYTSLAITSHPAAATLCNGGTNTLSVTASGGSGTKSYQWQSSSDNITFSNISGATSASYTTPALTTTTYYRVIVSQSGYTCPIYSNPAKITVVADPAISTQPVGFTECVGGTQALNVTATGGTPSLTYQWQSSANNVSFANISGATSASYTPASATAGTTYYRVNISASGTGCSTVTSGVATVIIVADPTISAQPTGFTECVGGNLALSVSASGGSPSLTYQWQSSSDNSNFSSISGATSATFTPASSVAGTTYYRVLVSASGNGCTTATSNAVAAVISADPAITTQPASTSVCTGGSTTLSVVATGGAPSLTYQWQSSPNGSGGWSSITGATSSSFTTPALNSTSYYRVVVSAAGNGCGGSINSNAATVTVNASITVGIVGTNAICPGASTALTASGGTSYAWNTGATTAVINVSPVAATTYIVTVTGIGGCTGTASRTVTVNPATAAFAGADATICGGSSTSLTATGSAGTAPYTYAWSGGLGNVATVTASPTTTTTYTVTVTSSTGCTATDQVVVNVNASPVSSAGSNVTVCSGTTVNLAASASGGVSPYTYNWNNGLGVGATQTVTPTAATIYTVTVTGSNSCTSIAQVSVNINAIPTANAGADATICQGQSTTLTATGSSAPAPFTFAWSNGFIGSTQTLTPANTTTYTVTVTSSNGCVGTDQKVVAVQVCNEICNNTLDDDGDGFADCADSDCGPSANAGSDINICPGGTAFLSVGVTVAARLIPMLGAMDLAGVPPKTVSPVATTTYTVTVTSASGCTSTDQLTVTVMPCSENCTNGIDDDGDGLVDCADPDCGGVTAPVLLPDSYTTCPGMTFSERVTYNDNNLNNPLFTIATNPAHGTVTIDWTGKFIYVPNGFDCVTDQFTYQVCNQSSGCCATANVTIVLGDNTTPQLLNVPADLTINCDDAIPVAPTVTGFDQCPGIYMDFDETTNQSYVGACGSYTITRTWTATDFCGNTTSDNQLITVVDLTKPELFKVHTMSDGSKMVAGVAQRVTNGWKYVRFPITFKVMPVVLANPTTNSDIAPIVVQVRNVSRQGFEVRLREEEAADGAHGNENVSWVAVEPGLSATGVKWEAGTLANVDHLGDTITFKQSYGSAPIFLPSIITNAQTDPATIRLTQLDNQTAHFFEQEETSADAEVIRLNETVGYMAIEPGQLMVDQDGTVIGEAGKVSVSPAWATINLSKTYTKPVVIIGGVTNTEGQPITLRVRNVTSKKFEVRLQEWSYLDGVHTPEAISWMVVEGSVPGEQSYYCEGRASKLIPNVNIMALDNCDDLVEFAYDQSSAVNGAGLLSNYSWTSMDDCGNTSLLVRADTCIVAALRLKTNLAGAYLSNGGTNLMRDDLRKEEYIPIVEPFSTMPSYPHVTNVHPKVTICHKPGQADQVQMEVEATELQAYLADGDEVGSCGLAPATLPTGAANANYRTKADGNWTDPATWVGGNIPGPFNNLNNMTISIEHKVTVPNDDIVLKSDAKLYITNGGLSVPNGFLKLQNAQFHARNSTIEVKEDFSPWTGTCRIDIRDSKIKVGGDFTNESGTRRLENVCLEVGGDYTCGYSVSRDTLINLIATVTGKVRVYNSAKMLVDNAKFRVINGNFLVESGCAISGSHMTMLIENGIVLNLGTWTASIDQYCIAGLFTLNFLGTVPAVEDCANLTDYFLSCDPDNILQDTNNGGGNGNTGGNNGSGNNGSNPNGPVAGSEGVLEPTVLEEEGVGAVVDWLCSKSGRRTMRPRSKAMRRCC
ncbi:MAG: choice-of-anchor A family protein [Saprospiraceae bacterium]|nr:choice-of-anchor A family protein [Saprospiraceae bacterium]